MNITVIRDSGDKAGPSISDSLLTTNNSAIERARVEIDTQYYSKVKVQTKVTIEQYIPNGSFVLVKNADMSESVALVTGMTASYKAGLPPEITIETERLL